MFKKINAVPFAKFTEFVLVVISAHVCVHVVAGVGECACASTDMCRYMLHSCFLYFSVMIPCETLMLLCLKVLVMI